MIILRKNREEEIEQVLGVIQDLCEQYEICLLPHTLEDSTQLIIVEDLQDGKQYALYIGE